MAATTSTFGLSGTLTSGESGKDHDFDLVVLGAGSAAFAAAIRASEAGYRVALVEEATVGGTCVNIGCVPSKALLTAGTHAWKMAHHPFAGVGTAAPTIDLASMVAAKDELVAHLRQAKYADLVDAYGFSVITGHARFIGPDSLDVDGAPVTSGVYLIATGASPSVPPIDGLAEAGFLTSTTALELKDIPRRLAVIGANAIGLELGQFFLHVGSQVTFLDVAERIAPFEEPEVSSLMASVLGADGAVIHTGARVLGVERAPGHVDVSVQVDGRTITVICDEVLVATGRSPNTPGLGLDLAGVATDNRGAVRVDDHLATSNPQVYAAGDVTGGPQFVYVSAYEGVLAVENALSGSDRTVDLIGLPRVTFTSPAIASAGLTEAQAVAEGYEVSTSLLPLDAVPRALVNRDTRGLVKLVAESGTRRLLGASVVAEGAGDVIQSAVLAIRHEITVDDIAGTFHPYLTMVEGLKLAAQTFERDVAKLSCCAV